MVKSSPLLLTLPLLLATGMAQAQQINSGEPDGVYQGAFCPRLEAELSKAHFNYGCVPSNGTVENVARVAKSPADLGYGQLDVFALEVARHGGPRAFTRLRVDDARECVFAVTRNRDITNYGEVAVFAAKLRFVVPPLNSGSTGTFRFLQQIDPTGIGAAKDVIVAASTEDALRISLSAEDTVGFFVQVPDPNSPRFKLIQELGGHVVPVLDRNILRQQIEDRKIYFAQETQVTNPKWLKGGTRVVTACTPLVVFTGNNDRVSGEKAKGDHKDLIATVVTMPQKDFLPKESLFKVLLQRTKELTGIGAERISQAAEEAREKSKPWIEKAKETTGRTLEQAKPAWERARQLGRQTLDKATEEARELLDRAAGQRQDQQQPLRK